LRDEIRSEAGDRVEASHKLRQHLDAVRSIKLRDSDGLSPDAAAATRLAAVNA
jgi:hypothetical protein